MDYLPKILIVDDEIKILRAIKRVLSQYELEVNITTSPDEALQILKTQEIDLIISDQRMPTMEGIELLKMAKVITPSTIRILMSGYADTEVFISAINNGSIFYYVSKPWDNEKLIKIILDAIQTKNEQKEQEVILNQLLKNKDNWSAVITNTKMVQRRELLNKIINNHLDITTQIIEEAKTLDLNLIDHLFIGLLSIDEKDEEMIAKTNELVLLLSLVPNILAWSCNDGIGFIYQDGIEDHEGTIPKTLSNIMQVLNNQYPNLFYIMGVSNYNSGRNAFQKAYYQAKCALTASKCKKPLSSSIYYYKDIGVLQLLGRMTQQDESQEFIDQNLGKIIAYDNEKGGELIRTLEELIKNDNLKIAAANLFIHPKTLAFRRNKIEELLGISLEHYETKLSLSIALKLYRIK